MRSYSLRYLSDKTQLRARCVSAFSRIESQYPQTFPNVQTTLIVWPSLLSVPSDPEVSAPNLKLFAGLCSTFGSLYRNRLSIGLLAALIAAFEGNRMKLFATEVFTPNQFPEYTYIERPKEDLEGKLKRALATPNVITSLSG